MQYRIKNPIVLRKLLWLDFAMGSSSGILGLLFIDFWVGIFGLSPTLIFWISLITALYSVGAFSLAAMREAPVTAVRVLVFANWLWTPVSLGFIFFHFMDATLLGQIWLVLQIIVVGGLAFFEGRQIERVAG